MKNLNLFKNKEADNYFLRNIDYYSGNTYDEKIIDLIKINKLKAEKILEIGCANGMLSSGCFKKFLFVRT